MPEARIAVSQPIKTQLFEAVADVDVDEPPALELELSELAAEVELSAGFDASPPDLLESPFFAAAGFAEEYRSLYHPPPLN